MVHLVICQRLTSITISDGVTIIKESAFENCISLTHVAIGKSVTQMGDKVFNGCTALTDVISWIDNPFVINSNCFPYRVRQYALLTVPKGTKSKYLSKRGLVELLQHHKGWNWVLLTEPGGQLTDVQLLREP